VPRISLCHIGISRKGVRADSGSLQLPILGSRFEGYLGGGAKYPQPVISEPDGTFRRERSALKRGVWPVAGCDEAGRGPLAGPVVATPT
jgi:hypothetical protein